MAYLSVMDNLRDWRVEKGFGLTEMARHLGIEGVNPGGTYVRIEAGSRQPDADMIERIIRFTDGAVTAAHMHETRLAWLRENRPDKFDASASQPERPAAGDHDNLSDGAAPHAAVAAGLQAGTGHPLQEAAE